MGARHGEEASRYIVGAEGVACVRYPLGGEQVCSLAELGRGGHAPFQQGFGLRIRIAAPGLQAGRCSVEVIVVSCQGKHIGSGDAGRDDCGGVIDAGGGQAAVSVEQGYSIVLAQGGGTAIDAHADGGAGKIRTVSHREHRFIRSHSWEQIKVIVLEAVYCHGPHTGIFDVEGIAGSCPTSSHVISTIEECVSEVWGAGNGHGVAGDTNAAAGKNTSRAATTAECAAADVDGVAGDIATAAAIDPAVYGAASDGDDVAGGGAASGVAAIDIVVNGAIADGYTVVVDGTIL